MQKTALKLIVSIVILLGIHVEAATFLCLFGPDSSGGYAEEVVNESQATDCLE